jgi:putative endonuclease
MIQSKQLGSYGEAAAAEHLKRKGYRILDRNYVTSFGEIDLVAQIDAEVVFVEVKTRSSQSYGEPYLAVSERKKRKYRQLALSYILKAYHREPAYRFDIISVVLNRITGELQQLEHFENAFV